jgi:hypothetical protein
MHLVSRPTRHRCSTGSGSNLCASSVCLLAYKRRKGKSLDLTSEHHEREKQLQFSPLFSLRMREGKKTREKERGRRVRLERRSSNRSRMIHPQGCEDLDPNHW